MGADVVFAYYGVKYEFKDEKDLDAIEVGTHEFVIRAKKAGLSYCFDRTTEGSLYFLLIGTKLGAIGIEASEYAEYTENELKEIHQRTKEKLIKGNFEKNPKLHIELAAQY